MKATPCTICNTIRTYHETGVCAGCRIEERVRLRLAGEPVVEQLTTIRNRALKKMVERKKVVRVAKRPMQAPRKGKEERRKLSPEELKEKNRGNMRKAQAVLALKVEAYVPETLTLTCMDCGGAWEWIKRCMHSRTPKRCPDCVKKRARAYWRAWDAKRKKAAA